MTPVKLGSFRLVCRQVVAGPRNQRRRGVSGRSAANPFRLPRVHPGIGSMGWLPVGTRAHHGLRMGVADETSLRWRGPVTPPMSRLTP